MASTLGLGEFGLMEIEARGYQGNVPSLHNFILEFAASLIETRPDIRDGHTIGRSQTERITVRIAKSMLYDTQVYCLNFQ